MGLFRSLLVKALPIVGTDDAVTAISKMMSARNLVSYNTQKQWITALSFMSKPTAKTIKAITVSNDPNYLLT